jgi:UDP-N-acetylglucosamine acyltransferase
MMIHPSAFVHPQAQVHPSATVGPWCLVDAGAVIGADVILESRVHVYGGVQVGEATHIYDGAVVGSDPQDLKYNGEPTRLHIGAHCRIREYCTLNRGTGEKGCTVVGDSVLLMAYTHVAHDCLIGQGAVLANGVQLGGHVRIGAYATIGGNTAVHQFSRVGDYAFVGGTLKIDRDVPPPAKRWATLSSGRGSICTHCASMAFQRNVLPDWRLPTGSSTAAVSPWRPWLPIYLAETKPCSVTFSEIGRACWCVLSEKVSTAETS